MSTVNIETSSDLEEVVEQATQRPRKLIICLQCRHHLADADDALFVDGQHEYELANPHGIVHKFRCFRDALGCAIEGRPTAADTWFPGYTWRLASCGNCRTHLGWFFEASKSFYGLLVIKTTVSRLDEFTDSA